MSVSIRSVTMYRSRHSSTFDDGGSMMSRTCSRFSWRIRRMMRSSRSSRLHDITSSSAFGSFLIAMSTARCTSCAEQITPCAPCPTCDLTMYRGSTAKMCPRHSTRFFGKEMNCILGRSGDGDRGPMRKLGGLTSHGNSPAKNAPIASSAARPRSATQLAFARRASAGATATHSVFRVVDSDAGGATEVCAAAVPRNQS